MTSRRLSVFGTALIALGLAGCADTRGTTPPMYQDLSRPGVTVSSGVVVEMVAQYRANHGLGALQADPVLMRVAHEQAEAMAKRGSVNLSLNRDRKLSKRLDAAGYRHKAAAENVSAGYRTIAKAFSGWRDSRQHDAVMRHPTATRMGIATAYSPTSKYKVFWNMIVAEPAD